ncbi:MoaD/ThiS family protein [Pseudonocardia xishanensis]|uniref:Molybdopterin synthase sulfur carrier subunit n=1 Tax=Pseudonocardia xishanensis TaxID=630995 RepID=A0ABP8RK13_9PSEU
MTQTLTRTVEVRYFAAARSAAGRDSETVDVPAGATVADLATLLTERNGPEFAKVVGRCSYLLDEVAVRDHDREIPQGAVVDVLPPFAGG